jgi:hypothetical protein
MTNQEKKECVETFEKWNSRIDTRINGELSEICEYYDSLFEERTGQPLNDRTFWGFRAFVAGYLLAKREEL